MKIIIHLSAYSSVCNSFTLYFLAHMKKCTLLVCFIAALQLQAQVVIEENPSYTTSTEKPLLDVLLKNDVLDGTAEAKPIAPLAQKFCFDKVFKVSMISPRGNLEACLFVNTKIGLLAHLPVSVNEPVGTCAINASDPDFALNVVSLKGNNYTYRNKKIKGVLQRLMTTDNSDVYTYVTPLSIGTQELRKKDASLGFLDGKVKAWAYNSATTPETWYLFGKNLPDKLTMQPNKYLGSFGIGFQYTAQGTFIIMQVEGGYFNSTVKELKDTYLCFDPSPYKKVEDELYTQGMQGITKKREKLRARMEHPPTGPCASLEVRNIQFELETLSRQEENLITGKAGNVKTDPAAMQARAQTINYDDILQQQIYETETDICKQEDEQHRLVAGGNSQSSANRLSRMQEKTSCTRTYLEQLRRTLASAKQVNMKFPNQPGKQYAEKARLYMQVMGNPCR